MCYGLPHADEYASAVCARVLTISYLYILCIQLNKDFIESTTRSVPSGVIVNLT